MHTSDLHQLIIRILEDYKAENIISLDVRELTDITECMVICTGTSSRQVQTIAYELITKAKAADVTIVGSEGEQQGEWVLVDLDNIIVHVMLPTTREFYSLEKLWGPTEYKS